MQFFQRNKNPRKPKFSGGFSGAQGRIRTTDTRIFSPLLYQLSYLATGMTYFIEFVKENLKKLVLVWGDIACGFLRAPTKEKLYHLFLQILPSFRVYH